MRMRVDICVFAILVFVIERFLTLVEFCGDHRGYIWREFWTVSIFSFVWIISESLVSMSSLRLSLIVVYSGHSIRLGCTFSVDDWSHLQVFHRCWFVFCLGSSWRGHIQWRIEWCRNQWQRVLILFFPRKKMKMFRCNLG